MTPGAESGVPTFLWCDIETPSLAPDAPILEVGLRTTDADLCALAEASWVVPYSSGVVGYMRRNADQFVQEMHDTSGLWTECEMNGWEAARARRRDIRDEVVDWIRSNAPGRLPVAGSSVRVDRTWLTNFAPEVDFEGLIHYRILDISSVRILARAWRPELTAMEPVPQKRHRVMPDLDDSIALAQFYREHVFAVPASS